MLQSCLNMKLTSMRRQDEKAKNYAKRCLNFSYDVGERSKQVEMSIVPSSNIIMESY